MKRVPPEVRKWMAAIGKQGGQVCSKRKAEAARINGRKHKAGEVSKLAKRLGISRQAAWYRIHKARRAK